MADSTNGKVSLRGKMNGQVGRPSKESVAMKQQAPCEDFSSCPSVQYCTIQAKCKKACDKSKSLCTGKNCGGTQ